MADNPSEQDEKQDGKTDGAAARGSLADDLGRVVGVATLVLLVVNVGVGSVLARIAAGQVGADPSDYASFARLYLSTFLLSGTITVAIAAYGVPRIYGYPAHWLLPVGLVVLGAWVSGLGVHWPSGMGVFGPFGGSLWMFAARYGSSFLGGVVVGLTGGVLIVVAVERYRVRAAPPAGSVPPALPWTEGLAGVGVLIVLASLFVWANRPEVSFRDVIRLAGTDQQGASYRVDLNVRNLGGESFTLSWSSGSVLIGSVPITTRSNGAWSTTVKVQTSGDPTFRVYGPEQLVVASTSATSSATISSVVGGPATPQGYGYQLQINVENLSGLNCHLEWRTVSDSDGTTLGKGVVALGQMRSGRYDYTGDVVISPPGGNGLPWHAVFTVATSEGALLASSAGLPSALVVQYTPGQQSNSDSRLYRIALTLELVNLKGQPCIVVWRTVYDDDGSDGATSGAFTIGETPNFGPMNSNAGTYVANLDVSVPNGVQNGRPWRVAFKVLSPGRAVLATG
ncbi:MAG TPA: hypothetical protein VL738_24880 [Dactylosporangium sp.]|jgi:hypothetical protein|nr:hypothetical protein [Dactylosporangium sp.]